MSAEAILTTVFDLLKDSEEVAIVVDGRALGMAYAIPKDTQDRVVDDYGPWSDAQVKQVFYQQSALVGEVLVDVQLVLSWRYNASQQYIVEANLDKGVSTIAAGTKLKISVRFGQPDMYDRNLEAYYIPFRVETMFSALIGPQKVFVSNGQIRADGTGTFPPFA